MDPKPPENRTDLTRRVEEEYRLVTGSATARGSRAWIARLGRLTPRTVSRILKGDLPPARIESVLDALAIGRQTAPQDPDKQEVDHG
jgi:hypothetical protein